mgnify:CR=1 FL=1
MKEQSYYNSIIAKHVEKGRIFRNVGTAYQGAHAIVGGKRCIVEPRMINFGLCVGSSDLIGWTEIEITPEMVGKKVAIFTAFEVKKKGKKPSPQQAAFLDFVSKSGGITEIKEV